MENKAICIGRSRFTIRISPTSEPWPTYSSFHGHYDVTVYSLLLSSFLGAKHHSAPLPVDKISRLLSIWPHGLGLKITYLRAVQELIRHDLRDVLDCMD